MEKSFKNTQKYDIIMKSLCLRKKYMNYRITNGSVSYGAETILEEINFEVKGKQKVAIVGRNGSGKSTLLNTQ